MSICCCSSIYALHFAVLRCLFIQRLCIVQPPLGTHVSKSYVPVLDLAWKTLSVRYGRSYRSHKTRETSALKYQDNEMGISSVLSDACAPSQWNHRRRILWQFLVLEGIAILLAASFRSSAGESSGLDLTFSVFLALLLPVAFMCKSRVIFSCACC